MHETKWLPVASPPVRAPHREEERRLASQIHRRGPEVHRVDRGLSAAVYRGRKIKLALAPSSDQQKPPSRTLLYIVCCVAKSRLV